MTKCAWCLDGGKMERYHDEEWGVPLFDDRRQFEYLSMEAMQCGLSWGLMMKKRGIFAACFAGFDIDTVVAFGKDEVASSNLASSVRVFCQH